MSDYRKGQRLRVTRERTVPVLIHWRAPLTSAVKAPVPVGTVLLVTHDPTPSSRGFSTAPEDYARLEQELVPEEDRQAGKYDGYSIPVADDEVGDWLEVLE